MKLEQWVGKTIANALFNLGAIDKPTKKKPRRKKLTNKSK